MPETLAAVDLGSNSFHLLVARHAGGRLTVVDRQREMVRLASGLTPDARLDAPSQRRALDCLARFGARIRDSHAERVRAVGTQTLRIARAKSAFLEQAADTLGQPIEIIAGREEARLIWLGATRNLVAVDTTQLVIDIGGGSTEIIRGHGHEPDALESLRIGCVGISQDWFGDGVLTAARFAQARRATRRAVEPVRSRLQTATPVRALGASGTIRAAHNVLDQLGETAGVTRPGLEGLIERMIAAGRIERLHLEGLSAQRLPVFPGGVAILAEVLARLGIERLQPATGALREGMLEDLIGRPANAATGR